MQLSRHFTLDELTFSQTAKAHGIDNRPGPAELASLRTLCTAVLDPLRDAVGRPIKVNSGYRGPALNARIGGSKSSQHMIGQAADLQAPGLPVIELFKTAIRLKLPFDQIIYEANGSSKWVHLSHRAGANRGEIRIAEFGPNGKPRAYPLATEAQALAMTEPATRSIGEPDYVETADEPPHGDVDAQVSRAATAEAAAPAPAPRPAAKLASAGTPGKKTAAKRAPAKKASAKTASAKKVAAKKVAAKKVAAKKTATTKAAAKKTVAKKAIPPRTAPKKSAVKKAAPPARPAARTAAAAKKITAKKTAPARKPAAKKTSAKKPAAKKASRRR